MTFKTLVLHILQVQNLTFVSSCRIFSESEVSRRPKASAEAEGFQSSASASVAEGQSPNLRPSVKIYILFFVLQCTVCDHSCAQEFLKRCLSKTYLNNSWEQKPYNCTIWDQILWKSVFKQFMRTIYHMMHSLWPQLFSKIHFTKTHSSSSWEQYTIWMHNLWAQL